MILLLTIVCLSVILLIYIKQRKKKQHFKACPHCGHRACQPQASNVVWRGRGYIIIYNYKCPECGKVGCKSQQAVFAK